VNGKHAPGSEWERECPLNPDRAADRQAEKERRAQAAHPPSPAQRTARAAFARRFASTKPAGNTNLQGASDGPLHQRAESPIASERRKLRRAVRAVRAALHAERKEALEEGIKISLGDGELRRPELPGSVEQRRRWPDRNEQLVPGSGSGGDDRLPDRVSFYKHLNRELSNGERRDVRAENPVLKRQAGY